MRRVMFSILSSVLLFASQAEAEPEQNPKLKQPPQQAIEACLGKKKGDEVTFTGRHGEQLEAKCQQIGALLAAVPKCHKRKRKPTN